MENSPRIRKQPPLKRLNLRNWTKKSLSILVKTFFFWRSPDFGKKIFEFGRKVTLNCGEDLFFWRSLDFGKKISEFGRKVTLNFGEDLFIFWRSPAFGRKKALSFRAFREISSQFSDKPFETASRSMKIPVKIVCTLLTLSK